MSCPWETLRESSIAELRAAIEAVESIKAVARRRHSLETQHRLRQFVCTPDFVELCEMAATDNLEVRREILSHLRRDDLLIRKGEGGRPRLVDMVEVAE